MWEAGGGRRGGSGGARAALEGQVPHREVREGGGPRRPGSGFPTRKEERGEGSAPTQGRGSALAGRGKVRWPVRSVQPRQTGVTPQGRKGRAGGPTDTGSGFHTRQETGKRGRGPHRRRVRGPRSPRRGRRAPGAAGASEAEGPAGGSTALALTQSG
jgi:hypothetical protein